MIDPRRLQRSELDHDVRDSAERIVAAGAHLLGLVDGLINTALTKPVSHACRSTPDAVAAYREGAAR